MTDSATVEVTDESTAVVTTEEDEAMAVAAGAETPMSDVLSPSVGVMSPESGGELPLKVPDSTASVALYREITDGPVEYPSSDSDDSKADEEEDDVMDEGEMASIRSKSRTRRVSSSLVGGGVPLSQHTPDVVINSIFRMFDTENTGFVDMSDFREILQVFGVEDLSAQLALTKLAQEQDGDRMTIENFRRWVKDDEAFLIIKDPTKLEYLSTVSQLFDQYDSDFSGGVTYKEWTDYFIKKEISLDDAKEQWDVCNPDGKDELTFAMFWKMFTA